MNEEYETGTREDDIYRLISKYNFKAKIGNVPNEPHRKLWFRAVPNLTKNMAILRRGQEIIERRKMKEVCYVPGR